MTLPQSTMDTAQQAGFHSFAHDPFTYMVHFIFKMGPPAEVKACLYCSQYTDNKTETQRSQEPKPHSHGLSGVELVLEPTSLTSPFATRGWRETVAGQLDRGR